MSLKRPTIALACIAKNEEENIERLLKSVEGCFDEIVITDTGSTDRTVEIAQSLGAQVKHFAWVNDFSAARNYSFSDIKSDYIMWLDLDDVLVSKEEFIRFRDNVLMLAECWIAPYHYSTDENGRPVCVFARERIIKNHKGVRWKYPIHEGMIPVDLEGNPLKTQMIKSWVVKHMRSAQDLLKDRSRNINIFETFKDTPQMDARMRYYYGKELFEAGKPKEATVELIKAASDEKLEKHDRMIAYQYACYAHMQLGEFEKAIEIAHLGLMLFPSRAEFHVVLGDCFLKLGNLADSVPHFGAAKACLQQAPSSLPGMIFSHPDCYTTYPRNQLAKIYANLGNLDAAKREAKECFELYSHAETKGILDELERVIHHEEAAKNAIPCDDIVISCPPVGPYEWDGLKYETQAMGGSETAAIEMAQWLHKLSGRPVKIFNMRKEPLTYKGVEYISTDHGNEYFAKNKPWLHIAWRHNIKLTNAPTFLWCHDLLTPGAEKVDNYNKILCLTPFHKDYVMSMQGISEDKIYVTKNGIRPDLFAKGPLPKDPNKFIFPSSPDRGLDRAMLVLDRVREKFPEIKLHVFYGIEHLDKYGLGALREKLKNMMDARPWVVYHGKTEQSVLMEHYRDAAIWLHPCDWIETSCISAMEVTASGVYPVTRRLGGLKDTLSQCEKDGMATLLDCDCVSPQEFDRYAKATIEALETKAWERVRINTEDHSWEKVAQSWLSELPKMF